MRAWWSGSAKEFCTHEVSAIVGCLALRLVENHTVNREEQLRAWREQILILQPILTATPDWTVIFEYPMIRLGRRIDVVLLSDRAIFVLEFKVGAASFTNADRQQVEDYALDLYDFHADSRTIPIVPVLVATAAAAKPTTPPLLVQPIMPIIEAIPDNLQAQLATTSARLPRPAHFDAPAWDSAPYRPVPTIVEAATMLYRKHGVADIAAARADVTNLGRTTDAIKAAIEDAVREHQRLIVFVTGIPGAGKTLCGLNAVFESSHEAAFLTGNLPLVHVLREALARDAKASGKSLRDANHKFESAIQPLLGFLRDNVPRLDAAHEHVIVFDEAQRAWDADFGHRKFQLDDSEAALFLDIMSRHRDWAVIVALVGNGQEINTGEAGLASWGDALATRPEWRIMGPASIIGNADRARSLAPATPVGMAVNPALHLDVSVRHIRSTAAADWVDAVLDGQADQAAAIARDAGGIPFRMTRSLPELRAALKAATRGSRRAGLVCSADAKRLRPDGLSADFPHMDRAVVANWFLNHWPDVRASDALELPATQYACQGLELDYVGLCWGGDLVPSLTGTGWQAQKFRGTKWQQVKRPDARAWQINTYRVLLSRARYETIIFIPQGDRADETRHPAVFDRITAFFHRCGAGMLSGTPPEPDVQASLQPSFLT